MTNARRLCWFPGVTFAVVLTLAAAACTDEAQSGDPGGVTGTVDDAPAELGPDQLPAGAEAVAESGS